MLQVLDLTVFSHIKRLCISGNEVALQIPASVSWEPLEVIAAEGLMLDFEDVNGFTQVVRCFSACYSHLHGTGALELCNALNLRGIKTAFQDKRPDGYSIFWFPAAVSPFACCCGGCLDCLIASGDILADAREAKFPCRPRLQTISTVFTDNDTFDGHVAKEEEEIYDANLARG